MYFGDPKLVSKYGNWVRVQVAFYDFIFEHSLSLCPQHFREKAMEDAMNGLFADGENFYERSVKTIAENFSSFDEAWNAFVANQEIQSDNPSDCS